MIRYSGKFTCLDLEVRQKVQYSSYHEIAPGWFRPQRPVVRDGDTERTEITFQEWQLHATRLDVFSGAALETKSLPTMIGERTGQ